MNKYISYTEGKCQRCGKDIKPRFKGRPKRGVCHLCRCRELRRCEKTGKIPEL